MTPDSFHERRRYPRVKTEIPLELRHPGSPAPLRATTSEISVGGCYIETMFTLDVGTKVEIVLWLDDQKLKAQGVVATRYPQVGNGIDLVEMAPEDRQKLERHIAAHAHDARSAPGLF
jgi:c-di-GMP-binding flagellar brake protein YcgR